MMITVFVIMLPNFQENLVIGDDYEFHLSRIKTTSESLKNGEFPDGSKTLRAKIDMAHPNINMRDPAMYRILHINHHRQGNKWCIYPMYDFAHPLQDSFEGITHSLCSLEYDNHRILYDWFIENCEMEHVSHQYEFGRLNITNTIMSKRYLRALVDSRKVDGYDDPRMPTLCGLRRRGFTADAIKNFILSTGLSRVNSTVDYGSLEEDGTYFYETTPYDPHSPYSASKASSDMLVKAYMDTYKFPANITNCSNNYGPYQFPEKLIPLIINNELTQKQSICLRYHYINGKSQAEIAKMLKLSQPTVSRHINAAKSIVNNNLKYCYIALDKGLNKYEKLSNLC